MNLSNIKWYTLATLGVLFWSFNVIVSRYLLGVLLPWQIAFFRWFIAALILLPFTYKEIWKYRHILLKHWKWVLLASAIGIAFCNTFVYIAGYTVTAVEMSLISVTGPVFLIVFSRLAGYITVSWKQKLGLALSTIGVFIIILHGRLINLEKLHLQVGDFWMLLMAMSFGFYSFLMTKKPPKISQTSLLSVTVIIGTIITIPLFIHDTIVNPFTPQNVNTTTVLIMIYMGLVNSVLAYLAWNTALDHLGSIKTGVVYYLMPVFSTIEAYFLLNEQIYSAQLWGGLLILVGIYMTNQQKTKRRLFIERP